MPHRPAIGGRAGLVGVLLVLGTSWGCQCGGQASGKITATVTATSPVVADGVRASIVTATVKKAGKPAEGLAVQVVSSRGNADAIEQPTAPTDAQGKVTARVRSTTAGTTSVSLMVAGSAVAGSADIQFIAAACKNGDTQPCYDGPAGTEGVGPCLGGTQSCTASGTWGTCTGEVVPAASDDTCNGIDDDCNGQVDDGVDPSSPATCGGCGNACPTYANATAACDASTGTCSLGACNPGYYDVDGDPSNGCEYACSGDPLATETCDGTDDNCNGQIDEGFDADGDGYTTCGTKPGGGTDAALVDCNDLDPNIHPGATEVCDGKDDDCNGTPDDGVVAPGGLCLTQGVCNGTAPTCTGAGGWVCNYPATYVQVEGSANCDGLDNDCDGTTDEGCSCTTGQTRPCGSNVGQCTTGTQSCNSGTWGACSGQGPVTEVCDGKDDDCNGVIDNGFDGDGDGYTTCGTLPGGGTSPSAIDCDDTNPNVHPGATEVCNGIDDNCNGQVDENGDASCSDGLFCNGAEVCAGVNGCQPGTPPDCTTLTDACNTGTCSETAKACVAQPRAAGTTCNDGNACTYGDACDATGTCVGTTITCASDACNTRSCNGTATCQVVKKTGVACSDGNACTYNDTCANGVCTGTAITCTSDTCNTRGCDGTSSCSVTPKTGAPCSTGSACVTGETCDAMGTCQGGTAVSCNDSNPCTADSCDPTNGCANAPVPDGTSCGANGEVCQGGICQCASGLTTETVCNDGVDNDCDGLIDCNDPDCSGQACNDGNACTTGETCSGTTCGGGTTKTCSTPPGQCYVQAGTCNPADGSCSYAFKAAGTACNDGNACTTGDACDGNGVCAGTAVACSSPPGVCYQTSGACDPSTGTCNYLPLASGAACDDGNACTYGDTCDGAGTCAGTTVTCTSDTCNTRSCNGTSTCQVVRNNGVSCDDGNACTYADTCSNGTCSGTAYTCTPGTCEQSSTCDGTGACTVVDSPAGTACSDGNFCTTGTTCDGAGACSGGTPTVCNDNNACTTDTCNSGTGACVYTARTIDPASTVSVSSTCLATGAGGIATVFVDLRDTAGVRMTGATVTFSVAGQTVSWLETGATGTSAVAVESTTTPGVYYLTMQAPASGTSTTVSVTASGCAQTAALTGTVTVTYAAANAGSGGTAGCSPADGNLRVKVTAAETGAAIASAHVMVGLTGGTPLSTSVEGFLSGAAPAGANTALTDAQGYATFHDYGTALDGPMTVTAGQSDTATSDRAYLTFDQVQASDLVMPLDLSQPTTPQVSFTNGTGSGFNETSSTNDVQLGIVTPELDLDGVSAIQLTTLVAPNRCINVPTRPQAAIPENFWVPTQCAARVFGFCAANLGPDPWALDFPANHRLAMLLGSTPLPATCDLLSDELASFRFSGTNNGNIGFAPSSATGSSTAGYSLPLTDAYSRTLSINATGIPAYTDLLGAVIGDYAGQDGTGPLYLNGFWLTKYSSGTSATATVPFAADSTGGNVPTTPDPAPSRYLGLVTAMYFDPPTARPAGAQPPASAADAKTTVLWRDDGSGNAPLSGAANATWNVGSFLGIAKTGIDATNKTFTWDDAAANGTTPDLSFHQLFRETDVYRNPGDAAMGCQKTRDVISHTDALYWEVWRPYGITCTGTTGNETTPSAKACFTLPTLPAGWPRAGTNAATGKVDGFAARQGSGTTCATNADCTITGDACTDLGLNTVTNTTGMLCNQQRFKSCTADADCSGCLAGDTCSVPDLVCAANDGTHDFTETDKWRMRVDHLGLATGFDFNHFDLSLRQTALTHESSNVSELNQ